MWTVPPDPGAVASTGTGLTPEELDRLLDAFDEHYPAAGTSLADTAFPSELLAAAN